MSPELFPLPETPLCPSSQMSLSLCPTSLAFNWLGCFNCSRLWWFVCLWKSLYAYRFSYHYCETLYVNKIRDCDIEIWCILDRAYQVSLHHQSSTDKTRVFHKPPSWTYPVVRVDCKKIIPTCRILVHSFMRKNKSQEQWLLFTKCL